jgi:glyoxylase-like metal-dependent hydrolase (beta-lactamase superfamily II)
MHPTVRSLAAPIACVLSLTLNACAAPSTSTTETTTSSVSEIGATEQEHAALETFTSDSNGFDTHSYWLDTGREVVVFDAQFTEAYAHKLIDTIRARTTSPIRWVVVTHPNPDKFNGAPAFQALGAKVVASASTARAIPGVHAYKKHYFVDVARTFTEATYPAQATVDVTFDGDYRLPLEGPTQVRLHELSHRGVSSTQTVAFLPQTNELVVGDLVHHKAHAWLEGGIVDGSPTPDLASWALALDELRAYVNATVYGGRGKTAKVDAAVDEEQAYLARMNKVVADYVAALGADARSELSGPNAGQHYKRLATLAGEAFPDYDLAYMIEYGVYGLALSFAQ